MTTTTKKRRGEGANYQFLPKQIREGRSISPDEKKVLGFIISRCIESDIYDNEGCMAISYDQLMKGAKIKSDGTIQHTIKSLKAKGCMTYIKGGHPGEANRYTLSRELTDMINQDEKKINFIPADDKKEIDMEQQAPEEKDYKKLYNSVYARFRNWIMDLSGMDSGKDGGKYIEEAVAFYRNHKDSNEQPDEEKNALQEENRQLKAEVEKLRKSLDASLQENTPQEQYEIELQKYKNSNNQLVEDNKRLTKERDEFKDKYHDKLLHDRMNQDVMKYKNEAEQLQEEVNRLRAENAQQKRTYERQIEELTDDIRGKEAEIKNLKKATSGEVSIVVEPATHYGGNVKTIHYN